MKYFLIFLMFPLLFAQEAKLNGKYYVDFENDFFQKDGYIDFEESKFTMKHSNLLPYHGTIKYGRTLTYLETGFNPDMIIDFQTNKIGKDTIRFQVRDKSSGGSYLHFSVNSGKFIKVK